MFFRILKSRSTYRPGTQFRTWMYQIARSAHVDRFRSRPREVDTAGELPEPASGAPLPGSDIERAEQTALVRRALAMLPADKREVLILSRFQELKYQEIGQILECEEGAVKVRVFRALRALRAAYQNLVGAPVGEEVRGLAGPAPRLQGAE